MNLVRVVRIIQYEASRFFDYNTGSMARVRLLHWKAAEAGPVLAALRQAGHSVDYEERFRPEMMREWRKAPPELFVIDLSRLPSHGKEIAIALRGSPATRSTPIVFCQGEAQKVASLRALLPDAVYCDVGTLADSVRTVLVNPRTPGIVPTAMMDRYSERTAAQKLGLREGSKVAVFEPPPHFEKLLGQLAPGVEWVEGDADVTLCFLHDPDSFRRTFSEMRGRAGRTRLWMLWRKKTSPGHSGIIEPAVREAGLALGLVDYKICSVNKDWSAMLFARKS